MASVKFNAFFIPWFMDDYLWLTLQEMQILAILWFKMNDEMMLAILWFIKRTSVLWFEKIKENEFVIWFEI
jgi:hypothetical protein